MTSVGPWSSGFSLGFGPLNVINATGLNYSVMQILGFSSTETLFYDEPDTGSFYLLRKPPIVPSLTLFRVSPNFARNWLVFSGLPSTPVYNPFGSNNTQHYSNEV